MNKIFCFFLIVVAFIGVSCQQKSQTLTILKVTEHGSARVSDSAIIDVLQSETNLKVKILYDLDEEVALKRLRNKTIDMAIIPSNTSVRDSDYFVRTVLHLLPRFLMVVTKPGIKAASLKDLMENNAVLYEDMSLMDSVFFEKLFLSFNINPAKVDRNIVDKTRLNSGINQSAVYIGLTHIHNPFVLRLLDEGWSFFPLDKVSNFGRGSSAEGFQLAFPWAYPFILPKYFHEGKPEEPVLTIAIRDVLVCREDFDEEIVYQLVRTLLENRASLVRKNNIYQLLPNGIERDGLSFPLSKGTLHYLNRDKPSIWLRYANMIWPILSVIAILAGAFASFQKRLKRQFKERIDTYYADLIRIRSQAIDDGDNSLKDELLEDLLAVRNRAFNALRNSKLIADESFNIFLKLYQEIVDEIQ